MFSKTCEYAIRALIFVAQRSLAGYKTGIREISAGIDSPESFTAKILQELVRKGLLLSSKGPTGGFFLDAPSLNYSLATIVRAIDGDKIFSGCGLGLPECSELQPCPIHFEFKKVRENVQEMLENARLCDFTRENGKEMYFLRR